MPIEALVVAIVLIIVLWRRNGGRIPRNPLGGVSIPHPDRTTLSKSWFIALVGVVVTHLILFIWAREVFFWLWDQGWFVLLHLVGLVYAWLHGNGSAAAKFARIAVTTTFVVVVISGVARNFDGFGSKVVESIREEGTVANYVLPRKLTDAPWRVYEGPVKDSVLAAFPSDTAMWDIAAAESNFRQFDTDGSPLLNAEGSSAVGVFQIMESLHSRDCGTSDSLDIHTLAGNIACAKILRAKNGYKDWASSAWKWRDRYATKPEHWEFDRTPEQLIAMGGNGDEVVIVDAPVGSPSTRVHTNSRQGCFDGEGVSASYLIRDDSGLEYTIQPGQDVQLTRYPRWLTFESLGTEPLKIVFKRRPHGVVGCPA